MSRTPRILVALCAFAAVAAFLPGCQEPTTKNPWQPDAPPLTADQLELEATDRINAAESWAEQELAGHDDAIAKVRKELDATRQSISRRVSAGMADIDRQRQQREGFLSAIQTGSGSLDLLVPGIGAVASGLLGAVVGRAGRQKREDAAYDLGKSDAHDERDERDNTWDEAQRVVKPDPTSTALQTLLPVLLPLITGRVVVTPTPTPAAPVAP